MRSRARGISRALPKSTTNNDENTGNKAALAAGAVGLMSNVNNPTVTSCAPDDPSFYCKLTRFFNSTQMILNLLVIFIAIIAGVYFAWSWFKGSSRQRKMKIGAV